jgi:succinate-semialdehyde dehydrogenase / glutarate-semialdehyde dehydrogenase
MSSFRSVNPWNGEVFQEYPPTGSVAIEQALTLAEHCFASWREQSFLEKSSLFHQLAQLLRAQKEELARLISLEVGKVISESRAEIEKMCAGL